MRVQHLTSVDGDLVFDLDPQIACASGAGSAGRVRIADDVTVDETALLARAATYEFAVFEERVAGAAIGIRPRLLDMPSDTTDRYRAEIEPLAQDGRFVEIREDEADVVATGRGVVAAASAWLGGLDGRSVGIEVFDAVGREVAAEVVRRGGTVVAVSTRAGAVADAAGLDLAVLDRAREEHGESFVLHLDLEVHRRPELHGLLLDVLIPGSGTGTYTAELADDVQAKVISPAVPVPYTPAGLEVLHRNGVVALPDFVTAAGGLLARRAPGGLPPHEVLDRVDRLITERIEAARTARMDPIEHATVLADTFLATWIPVDHLPDGPAPVW